MRSRPAQCPRCPTGEGTPREGNRWYCPKHAVEVRKEQNAQAAGRARERRARGEAGFTEEELRQYHRALYRLLVSISRFRSLDPSEEVEVIVEVADEVVSKFDLFLLRTDDIIPRTQDDPRTAYEERYLGDPVRAEELRLLWDEDE